MEDAVYVRIEKERTGEAALYTSRTVVGLFELTSD
jgi:hypothetical protein